MERELLLHNTSLHKFWEHTKTIFKSSVASSTPEEWNQQVYLLAKCGRATEEALNYLYLNQPSYDTFIDWLLITGSSTGSQLSEQTDKLLSKEDLDSWNRNGYIIIKNAVTDAQCEAARIAIWNYLDADPLMPATWYRPHDGKKGMMLDFFHHPALDTNRHSMKIRKAYEELYSGINIYLLLDKVSFNPPETKNYKFQGSPLHWDVSLQLPIPFVLQGLLYLNDVAASDGAFKCVPGFHKQIDQWMAALPSNTDPRLAATMELRPVAIPGNAGDLIIWHHALPHCASPNKGTLPRMVQYIAYKPVRVEEQPVWK